MISKKRLAIVELVALLVGLGFTLTGLGIGVWFIMQSNQSTSNNISSTPVGFVFGNSENLTQEATYFQLHLENVEFSTERVKAELYMQIECQKVESPHPFYSEKSVFFLLQVPSDISDVKVNYRISEREPQFFGGNFQIIDSTALHSGLSAILVEIPKENFTFGENEFLVFYFTMDNFFSNVNSYTYQRAITFSNNFDDAVRDLMWQRRIIAENTAVFRFLYKAELDVEEPYEVNSQLLPLPQGIHYYSNHTHYSWNVKTIASSVGSDSVITEFEDIPTKNLLLSRENFMWFSLGLGFPLFISSLFEFLRKKDGLSQIQAFTNLKLVFNRNNLSMDKKEVDKVFELCLLLVTVIAAAELQYASFVFSQNSSNDGNYLFRVTTIPIFILVTAWIILMLFPSVLKSEHPVLRSVRRIPKEFCWAFFGNFFVLEMLLFFSLGFSEELISYGDVALNTTWFSFLLTFLATWQYRKIDRDTTQATSRFGRAGFIAMSIGEHAVIYGLSYYLLIAIVYVAGVLPPP